MYHAQPKPPSRRNSHSNKLLFPNHNIDCLDQSEFQIIEIAENYNPTPTSQVVKELQRLRAGIKKTASEDVFQGNSDFMLADRKYRRARYKLGQGVEGTTYLAEMALSNASFNNATPDLDLVIKITHGRVLLFHFDEDFAAGGILHSQLYLERLHKHIICKPKFNEQQQVSGIKLFSVKRNKSAGYFCLKPIVLKGKDYTTTSQELLSVIQILQQEYEIGLMNSEQLIILENEINQKIRLMPYTELRKRMLQSAKDACIFQELYGDGSVAMRVNQQGNQLYTFMQQLPGETAIDTVRDIIGHSNYEFVDKIKLTLKILVELAQAFENLHEKGIAHNDGHLSNIMVEVTEDLGARVFEGDESYQYGRLGALDESLNPSTVEIKVNIIDFGAATFSKLSSAPTVNSLFLTLEEKLYPEILMGLSKYYNVRVDSQEKEYERLSPLHETSAEFELKDTTSMAFNIKYILELLHRKLSEQAFGSLLENYLLAIIKSSGELITHLTSLGFIRVQHLRELLNEVDMLVDACVEVFNCLPDGVGLASNIHVERWFQLLQNNAPLSAYEKEQIGMKALIRVFQSFRDSVHALINQAANDEYGYSMIAEQQRLKFFKEEFPEAFPLIMRMLKQYPAEELERLLKCERFKDVKAFLKTDMIPVEVKAGLINVLLYNCEELLIDSDKNRLHCFFNLLLRDDISLEIWNRLNQISELYNNEKEKFDFFMMLYKHCYNDSNLNREQHVVPFLRKALEALSSQHSPEDAALEMITYLGSYVRGQSRRAAVRFFRGNPRNVNRAARIVKLMMRVILDRFLEPREARIMAESFQAKWELEASPLKLTDSDLGLSDVSGCCSCFSRGTRVTPLNAGNFT